MNFELTDGMLWEADEMHGGVEKLIAQYKMGIITRAECSNFFLDSFEYEYGATDLRATAGQLPDDVFAAINDEVSTAPNTEEGWARFRMMRGCGVFDANGSLMNTERSLANSQAHYYRFVVAWRKAFAESDQQVRT